MAAEALWATFHLFSGQPGSRVPPTLTRRGEAGLLAPKQKGREAELGRWRTRRRGCAAGKRAGKWD